MVPNAAELWRIDVINSFQLPQNECSYSSVVERRTYVDNHWYATAPSSTLGTSNLFMQSFALSQALHSITTK
jgi:hypothetical protein